MKVEGVSSSVAAANRKAEKIAASGFALPSENLAQANNARAAASSAGIANVGSLLALQTIPDAEEKRRRATRRANNLLDKLEGLRVATLSGNVTTGHLTQLSASLREQMDEIEDANLKQILDEIELRAEVELAKLEASK